VAGDDDVMRRSSGGMVLRLGSVTGHHEALLRCRESANRRDAMVAWCLGTGTTTEEQGFGGGRTCGAVSEESLGWTAAAIVPACYSERMRQGSMLRVKTFARLTLAERRRCLRASLTLLWASFLELQILLHFVPG
jgi:hypothetical protein